MELVSVPVEDFANSLSLPHQRKLLCIPMAFTGLSLPQWRRPPSLHRACGAYRAVPSRMAGAPDYTLRVSRRAALNTLLAVSLAPVLVKPGTAHGESLREAGVRRRVTSLIESRARAKDLLHRLQGEGAAESLSDDEAEYVARATPVWLSPAVSEIEGIVSSDVDVGSGIDTEGRALAIHLAELADERKKRNWKGCVRELEEYIDTLDAVLSKDGLARFVHGRRWNGKAWIDM